MKKINVALNKEKHFKVKIIAVQKRTTMKNLIIDAIQYIIENNIPIYKVFSINDTTTFTMNIEEELDININNYVKSQKCYIRNIYEKALDIIIKGEEDYG